MHKKNLLFLLASSFFSLFLRAQQVDSSKLETAWRVDESGYNTTPYNRSDRFEKSIVYLSAASAVAMVEIPKEGSGVIQVFADGTTGWEYRIQGKIIGIGRFGNGVIAFYEPKKQEGEIHAVTLEAGSGKQLLDKIVYQGQQELREEIIVQNRPSGIFNDLLIRVTPAKRIPPIFVGGEYKEKSASSASCKALFFSPDLAVDKTISMKVSDNFRFLGSLASEEGSIYVCNKVEGQLVVEEWNGETAVPHKLHVPFETKEGSIFYSVMNLDAANGKNVLAAVSYHSADKDNTFQVFQFNFAARKAGASEPQICDKSYARGVEPVEIKGISKSKLPGSIYALVPQKILRVGDKVVVIRDSRTFSSSPSNKLLFVNGPSLVTFLDNQLKTRQEFALLKNQESYMDLARSLGARVQNDKLYLVSSALTGASTYANLYYVINGGSMTVEKAGVLRNIPGGGAVPAESDATFWFSNYCLLNRIRPKNNLFSSVLRISTVLDKQSLE